MMHDAANREGSLLYHVSDSLFLLRLGTCAGNCLLLDLLLQLQDAVENRLRVGRAAGDIDVYRHYLVDPLDHSIGREGAARRGAVAYRDAPLRLGHLVPDGAHHRGELLGDRAAHQHHVALAGREAVKHTKALEHVEARDTYSHHLDSTTRRAQDEGPHRIPVRPVEQEIGGRSDHAWAKSIY